MKDKHKRRPPAARDATHPAVQTSCLAAVRAGELERVRVHLQEGAAVNGQDENGFSLLFHAIFRRHFAIAGELLARGADIDLANSQIPPAKPVA